MTLENLAEMVKQGQDFVVYDAKSGDDITRSVLTQIIFEEEGKGQHLLPNQFLRQLIRFYGDSLQSVVPSYLEMSMETFARNQEQLRSQLTNAFGSAPAFNMFEEQIKQNVALFDRAVKMFTPFSNIYGEQPGPGTQGQPAAPQATPEKDSEIDDLKSQISMLKQRLDEMSEKS